MSKRMTRPTARVLSMCLVLALLVLVSGFSSAQTRDVSTYFAQVAKLTASDADVWDEFGYPVSISGDTVVAGAYGDDDNGDWSGSAYLLEKPEAGWADMTETAKLTASDGEEGDFFGRSMSISGDTVVAGAAHGDDSGDSSGSAYLFERPESGWTDLTETAKLTASDGAEADVFGASVSIGGDTLVVGAPGDDRSGYYSVGAAYLFERDAGGPGNWGQVAKLTASGVAEGDRFGGSVSISGDTVVVGALKEDNSGLVYLFEKPGGGWTDMAETAQLAASDIAAGDYFGESVSISGDTVVVGAWGDDDSGDQSGSAYLFEKPGPGWANMTQTAKLTVSDGAEDDRLGFSVSISGETVFVGAWGDDDNGDKSGSAYLFEKPEAGWADMTETAKITASDGAEDDFFGYSVSASGNTLVASSHGDDDNADGSGSAYVFFYFEPITSVYLPVVLRSAP